VSASMTAATRMPLAPAWREHEPAARRFRMIVLPSIWPEVSQATSGRRDEQDSCEIADLAVDEDQIGTPPRCPDATGVLAAGSGIARPRGSIGVESAGPCGGVGSRTRSRRYQVYHAARLYFGVGGAGV